MTFDSARGVTVLYGGYNGISYLSDTREWNGTNWTVVRRNQFTEVTGPGGITFHAKDLSNDDEPMLSNDVEHKLKSMSMPKSRFAIGGYETDKAPSWDGLIDDVRVSKAVLRNEQLLLTSEGGRTEQHWHVTMPHVQATAHVDGITQTRSSAGQYNGFCQQGGLEVLERADFANEGARMLKMSDEGILAEDQGPRRDLSRTQLKVLLMRSEGLSNKQVAQALGRHEKTVECHVTEILRRLEARNMIDAIRIATKHKLIL